MGIGIALRFWDLADRPGYEWDEPTYSTIASNLLDHGELQAKSQFDTGAGTYLYHPPFYFLLLARWFAFVGGSGIVEARLLAALTGLLALVCVYVLVRRWVGPFAGILLLTLLVTDGWLVFTNRISWMDNTLVLIGVLGLWTYDRAFRRGRLELFVLAGALLGLAAIFKHMGLIFALAVGVHWALMRRYTREHLVLAGVVIAVVIGYFGVMVIAFDRPGGNDFLEATSVQVRRALGSYDSGGTIATPGQALGPILHQYKIFFGTLVVSGAGVVIVGWRIVQAVRARSLAALRRGGLPYAWALAALVSCSAIQLRFPQYFMLLLLPLYLVVAIELREHIRRRPDLRWLVIAGIVALLIANGITFQQRFVIRDDNALRDTAEFVSREVPEDSLIITEEPVAALVEQPYCEMWRAATCARHAAYLITYESATLPVRSEVARLAEHSSKIAAFEGFKETVTVYRLSPSTASRGWVEARQ